MNDAGLFDRGALVIAAPPRPVEVLRLSSTWSSAPVYWRVFDKNDRVYAVGLQDGVLTAGQSVSVVLTGVDMFSSSSSGEA